MFSILPKAIDCLEKLILKGEGGTQYTIKNSTGTHFYGSTEFLYWKTLTKELVNNGFKAKLNSQSEDVFDSMPITVYNIEVTL